MPGFVRWRRALEPDGSKPQLRSASAVVRSDLVLVDDPDHEPLAVAEQPPHERRTARARDVVEPGANVREAPRRLPRERVAHPDPVRPRRQSPSCEVGQLGSDLQAVRLDVVRRPPRQALHQVPAGAADVEERPVTVDRVGDVRARVLPVPRRPTLAGLLPRRGRGKIGRHEERSHLLVPAVFVELAPLEPPIDLGQLTPRVVLQVRERVLGHPGRVYAEPMSINTGCAPRSGRACTGSRPGRRRSPA